MDGIQKIIKKQTESKTEANKHIHSEVHYLADEISTAFDEKRLFGMYLGVIKRIGIDRAKQIFAELKESNVKSPGRLFIWKSKPENNIPKKFDQNKFKPKVIINNNPTKY
jgi:hypothetical protein